MKALLAAAAALAMISPANAINVSCAPWPVVNKSLATRFHQKRVSGGMINDHVVFTILASPNGETWTALAVDTNGTACVLSVGTGWSQPAGDSQ